MFRLLKRRFYSVVLVIGALVLVILISAYMSIDRALVNDYSVKTEDIANKTINDFKVKTDYVETMSLLFIENLLAKTDNNGEVAEYDFNSDVSKIKIYNGDIDGLGIFWDDGRQSLSGSLYMKYISELKDTINREKKTCWVIVERNGSEEDGYLFLLTPVTNLKNMQSGFALVDATSIKRNVAKDNLFLKDAVIHFEANGKKLLLTSGKTGKDDMVVKSEFQNGLKMVVDFPMNELKNQLMRVKMYICLFGILFIGLAIFAVQGMVNGIVKELEMLKNEIDEFALSKEEKI